MSTSVLYETPGPRAKRRAVVASVAVSILLLAVFGWILYRLGVTGELAQSKWGPLIDPTNDNFVPLWSLLGTGLVNTLTAAGWAILFSLVIGTVLAVTRVTSAPWYRWIVVGVVELLRGIPVVVLIFFAANALPQLLGVDWPTLWSLVIGLTAYNCVIIAEIIRAGILSLPQGQSEAAYAIGMRRGQVLTSVLLPQAFRAMLPALISQLVVVLKDTSLAFVISFPEFVYRGKLIIQNLNNPIQTYVVIAVVFILLNYTLSRLAVYTERRLSAGRKAPTVTGTAEGGD